MSEIKVTVLDHPGSISKRKAAKIMRQVIERLNRDPEFIAAIKQYIEEKGAQFEHASSDTE